MFKNTAAKFYVFAFDSTTNLPKTGDAANITAYVAKDFGSVTVLADTSATEVDTTNAKGMYVFDAAQGETNGDILMVSGKSSTSNIVVVGAPQIIYTFPTTGILAPATLGRTAVVDASGLIDANTVKMGATGAGDATAVLNLVTSFNDTAGAVRWLGIVDQGTAQAATGTTLQLRSAAAFADSELVGSFIYIATATTGAGQWRAITGYVGSTDTATVDTWTTTPTGTITYKVVGGAPGPTTAPDVNVKTINSQTVTAAAGVTFPTSIASPTNILTTALTEAYRANGATGTLTQILYEILAHMNEASISGTTKTLKKLDHSTSAATLTLDSSSTPTSITRST